MARTILGLSALLAVAGIGLASWNSTPGTDVVAAGHGTPAPAHEAVRPPAGRVLQGEVVAVHDKGREVEASITLQWAPQVARVDERAIFSTTSRTRVKPSDGGIRSLRPGEPVEIVAVPEGGEGWRAVEITKLDLD